MESCRLVGRRHVSERLRNHPVTPRATHRVARLPRAGRRLLAIAVVAVLGTVLAPSAFAVAPWTISYSNTAISRTAATYSVTFSESVTGLATADFAASGTSTGWTISSVTGSGAGPYTVTLANATAGGAPAGTHILTLAANGVTGGTGTGPATAQALTTTLGVPTSTAVPTLSGITKIGETLSCGTGSWTAVPAITTYAYQWQISADGSTGWANATSTGNATASYVVNAVDVTKYLRCNATATNAYGASAAASSSATAIITRPDFVYVASNNSTAATAGITGFAVTSTGALAQAVTTTGPATMRSVAQSKNGRYLYGATPTTIYQYAIGQGGGLTALSPASVAAGVTTVWEVEVSKDGRFLYAVSRDDGKVYVYAIGADGQLTAVPALTTTVGGGPLYITFNAAGTVAYVVNRTPSTVSQFSVDTTTGALTPLTPATVATGSDPIQLAITPDAKWAYVTSYTSGLITMYSVNAATGALTPLTAPATVSFANAYGLAISADSTRLWASSWNGAIIGQYAINGSTGRLTALSPATVALAGWGSDMLLTPNGQNLYVTSNNASTAVSQFAISGGLASALSPASANAAVANTFTPIYSRSRPVVASFAPTTANVASASAPITFSLSFTEPVTGLTTGDFSIGGASGWGITGITGSGSGPYTLTVAPTGATGSQGDVTVTLAVDAVTDALTLTGPTMTESATATVDTVAPTVASTSLTSLTRTAATYAVTFSEPMTTLTTAMLSNTGTSTGWTFSSVTGSGAGPYTITLANATAGGAPTGTVIPTFSAAATDVTGNAIAAGGRALTTATIAVPANTVAPATSGVLRPGETLTATTGTWASDLAISGYTYQWQVSANGSTGWANATGAGATTASYTVAPADVWKYLRVTVVAANAFGSGTAAPSAANAVIQSGEILLSGNVGSITARGIRSDGSLSAVLSTTTAGSPNRVGDLVISPDGRFAYGVNYFGNNVSMYALDASGAVLTSLATPTVATGSAPFYMVITPDQRFAYVSNYGGGTVSQYAIGADGTLTPLSPATITVGTSPYGMVLNAAGTRLYVVNRSSSTVSQLAVDSTTGQLSALTPATVAVASDPCYIAMTPNGQNVYVASYTGAAVNQFSVGAGGVLAPLTPATLTLTGAHFPVVSPDGTRLFVERWGVAQAQTYTIGAGGALTAAGTLALGGTSNYVPVLRANGQNIYFPHTEGLITQAAISGGALTAMTPATVSESGAPWSLAIVGNAFSPSSFAPSATATNAATVTYTLTFNRPVTGLTAADFSLTGTATGFSVTGVAGSGAGPYTVTVAGPSSPTNGTLILTLQTNSVTDVGGNVGPTQALPVMTAPTVTYDNVVPTVTSLALTSSTRAAATYTASFSEPVTGVTAAKLTLGGTSTGWTVSSVTGSGAGPYVFTLANATAGGAPAGTLIPTLALGAGSDPAGNQSVRLIGTSTSFGVPGNTAVPVVSGTLRGANTLTATSGTWPQVPTSTYAYQWQVSVDGATGWTNATGDGNATASYKVAAVDVGDYVRVAVTATNAYGSATAYSSSAAASAYILPSLVVYTQNAGANTISVFNRLASGQLTPISPAASATVAVAASPRQSVVSPDGRFVYVTSYTGNAISQFSAGPGGDLTALSPATVTASAVYKLAIAPNGRFLYATGYGCSCIYQYAIGATGALTALTPATVTAGSLMNGITVSPNSANVYAVSETDGKVYQYAVGAGGALTALSPASVAAAAASASAAVVVAPGGGYAYVASYGSNAIYQYSVAAGGQLTALSPASVATGAATAPNALAINSTGTALYATLGTSAQVLQYTIGGAGTLTAKSPAGVAAAVATLGVAVMPDGTNLYAGSNSATSVHQFSATTSGVLSALSPATVTAGTTTQYPTIAVTPPAESAYTTPLSTLYQTIGSYTVTFNRALDPATVSTSDFVLSGTSTGWTVSSVAAVAGSNNTRFTVGITGSSPTDGSIVLDMNANSIADTDGAVGPAAGPGDVKAATIQYLQNPAGSVTAAGFQGYNVITWTPPADTASITGWKIYWGLTGGAGMTNAVSLSGASTAVWKQSGLTIGTPYYYKVVAVGPSGESLGTQVSGTPGWTKSVPFACANAAQTFTVPAGVTALQVDAVGARGSASTNSVGGRGGRVQGGIAATPGQVLQINVGCSSGTTAGGWNGGGVGYSNGGGGGGATDIRTPTGSPATYPLANRIWVAGGGGGAGNQGAGEDGGAGGGLTGGQGLTLNTPPSFFGGYGGTQVAGGVGGQWSTNAPGSNGSLGTGGGANSSSAGGGGGGGYYGGGGGAWNAGGGGSSYALPTAFDVSHTQGYATPADANAPTATTATPGMSQIVVSWTASTASGLTGYKVYRGTTPNPTTQIGALVPAGTTTYTDTTPTSGTTYFYRVTAVSASGESAASRDAAAQTGATTPTVASLSAGQPSGLLVAGATLWVAVNYTRPVTVTGAPTLELQIGQRRVTAAYAAGSGTSSLAFTYTIADNDAATWIDVTGPAALALNGGTIKDTANAAVSAINTLPVPGSSTSLSIARAYTVPANGGGYVQLTYPTSTFVTGVTASGWQGFNVVGWAQTDVANAAYYRIYGGTTTNPTTVIGTAPIGTNSFRHEGLAIGTAYYYKVSVVDTAGNETPKSAEVTATPTWTTTSRYSCTGAAQTFAVPAGVTALRVDAYGARGGASTNSVGGLGGRVQGVLPVTASSTLNLYVGCSEAVAGSSATAGWNGGGAGYSSGGNGGGATDIRTVGGAWSLGTSVASRVWVAGGGGGAGNQGAGEDGGAGGGLTGGQGLTLNTPPSFFGGYGGTQAAGGVGGQWSTNAPGSNGSLGTGGGANSSSAGGGGGGGYYGGGGGAWNAGGGGSSYALPTAFDVSHTQGYATPTDAAAPTALNVVPGNGSVSVSWTASPANGLVGYKVYRGTSANPTTQLGALVPAGTTSYTDAAAVNGTTYLYRVTAVYTQSGRTIESAPTTDGSAQPTATGSAASVVSVSSPYPSGVLAAGSKLWIRVNFSKPVTVTGSPLLKLQIGARQADATYGSGTGTTALIFSYVIRDDDAASWIDVASTTALSLNGGTIKDAATANATLTLPAPGTTNSLSVGRSFQVPANAGGYLALTYPTTTFVTGVVASGWQGYDIVGWDPTTIAGAAYYKVYGGTSPNPAAVVGTVPIGLTSFRHPGLTLGTTYYYRVSVVDNAGNETPKSAEAKAAPAFQAVTNFGCTNAAQTYTVPAGVTAMQVDAVGAAGVNSSNSVAGGLGGRVQGVIPVTAGSTLNLYVGCTGSTTSGGWNGGGQGYGLGAGGGGATDIRVGGTAVANRVLVAGGGAGAGYYGVGGAGGGLTGGQGATQTPSTTQYGGFGGSQTAGGAGGFWPGPYTSSTGTQSVGGGGNSSLHSGGGGGGYWGGGGGSHNGAGGGSSYTTPSAYDVTHTQGYVSATGNGRLSLIVPATTYVTGMRATGWQGYNAVDWEPTTVFDAVSYKVYGGTTPDPATVIATLPISSTEYRHTGLTFGTTYYYRVSIVDSAGQETPKSSQVTATPTTTAVVGRYNCTGAAQTFVVPGGLNYVLVDAIGAAGVDAPNAVAGGLGGRVQSTLAVTPGSTLNLYVGCTGSTTSGGWNGGGQGYGSGAGGGGATDIRTVGGAWSLGTSVASRVLVAGGGGGAGYYGTGGAGGGLTGAQGRTQTPSATEYGGYGGSQSAGGVGGIWPGYANGTTGTQPLGGSGVSTLHSGGGGGGYWGGGGGAHNGAGGGSSYGSAATFDAVHTQGYASATGNGSLVLTAPTSATPTGVKAIPGDAQVVVSWDASPVTGLLGYRVYRGTTANPTTQVGAQLAATATSYVDATAVNGTTYTYRVVAVFDWNGTPTLSDYSANVTGAPAAQVGGNTATFNCTSAAQTWTVPSGVSWVTVDAYGARGVSAPAPSTLTGGAGGRVQGSLPVTAGSTLNVYVGCTGSTTSGGWNGGGQGYASGAGGGGATDIRTVGGAWSLAASVASRVLVAGGGGGAGYYGLGGAGGGLTGGQGSTTTTGTGYYGGFGGSQTAGGGGGGWSGQPNGSTGTQPTGGAGVSTLNSGGGGGGYWGGGGGSHNGAGGGSSYTASNIANVTHTQGYSTAAISPTGNGKLTLTWQIDTTAPTVTGITSTAVDGTYLLGAVIPVKVQFSEGVNVTGTPTLQVNAGSVASPRLVTLTYASGSGSSDLTFTYTVGTGDNTAALDIASTTALALAGGTIKDGAANSAVLTLPAPGAAGSLAANRTLRIDAVAPNVPANVAIRGAGNAATLSWTASGDPDIASYRIYKGTSANPTTQYASVPHPGTSYTDRPLPRGITLCYRIKAIDTAGNESAYSADLCYTVPNGGPSEPTVVAAATSSTKKPLITGTSDPGTTVAIYDGASLLQAGITVDGNGNWSWRPSTDLTTGFHEYSAVATEISTSIGSSQSPGVVQEIISGDVTPPTFTSITTTTPTGSYRAGTVIPLAVKFNEAMDVDTTGGTPRIALTLGASTVYAPYASGLGTDTLVFNYTVVSPNTTSALDYASTTALELRGGVITDLAGNLPVSLALPAPGAAGSIAAAATIAIDTTAPTVSTFTCPTSTRTASVSCSLLLSESVSGVTAAAFTVGGTSTGWTVDSVSGAGAGPYTVTLSAPAAVDGTVTLQLDGSLVADLAGNVVNGTPTPTTGAVAVDGTAPTVTSFTGPSTPTSGTSKAWTLTLSEAVSGLTTADFSVGGTATGWTVASVSGSGPYTVTLTGTSPADGTLYPILAAGGVADAVGNTAPAAATNGATITLDNTAPTATAFTATSPTKSTTITYSLTLSEAVTGLTTSSFAVGGTATGWSVTGLSGTGTGPYTVTVSGALTTAGTVLLSITGGALADAAANANATISANAVTVDRTAPTVTLVPAVTLTNGTSIAYTATFSEAVTGLSAGKLAFSGTSTGWAIGSVTGSGTTYTINAVGPSSPDGTVILTLAQNAVVDTATNAGPATATAATTVTVDRSAPTVSSFAPTTATPTNATSLSYSLTFSGAVTGLTAADFALTGTSTGWTVGTPTGSGAGPYTIPVTASNPTNGTVILTLAADAVTDDATNTGPATAQAASTITIDRTVPTVTAFAPVTTSPSNSGTATFSITFSKVVTGISTSDFSVLTATGWTVASVAGTGAGPYTVTLTNGSPADSTLGLRIAAAAGADAAGNTVPAANSDATATITIDVSPPSSTPVITAGPASAISTTATSVTFSGAGAGETYQCRIDSGTYVACTSPQVYAGLSEGSHTIDVRILDAAGNATTPASSTFAVDTTAPTSTVAIPTKPADPDNDSTPTFAFTGAAGGETYQCQLGSGAWATCATPYTVAPALTEGVYTLRVRTADAAGNTGSATAYTWTLDLTSPASAPTILTSPANPSAVATGTFTFGGAITGETYECRIDSGAWTACTTPLTTASLADGSHSFAVHLRDGAGNTGPATMASWTIDTTVPTSTATITSGPSVSATTSTATFGLAGAISGEGYQCRIDGGAWTTCTTPWQLTGLADGSHTFDVRTADAAGNGGPTTSRVWLIDTVAPSGTPVIGGRPNDPTAQTTASLTLTGAAAGETYACSVDGAAFAACTSPLALTGLTDGGHAVRVHLADAAGNVGPNASVAWTVDATPPTTAPAVSGLPTGSTTGTSASFTITGEAGTTPECRLDGGAWGPCVSALTGLSDGTHTLEVRSVDAAGNRGPISSTVWTVDTAIPASPTPGAMPPATSDTSSQFTFTGEPSATFACRFREVTGPSAPHTDISVIANWYACSSPVTSPTRGNGTYALDLRQTDAAGNASPDQTIYWTIDTNAPASVDVTNIPASPTTARTAAPVLHLTSNDVATATVYTLECKIDNGSWLLVDGSNTTTCPVSGSAPTYTLSLSGLAEGNHSVSVRQLKKVGNSAAIVSDITEIVWTVDITAPAAPGIATQPASPTNQTSAAFTFTKEAGSTLECQLDGGAWAPCASPYTGLASGSHTLVTRAVDSAGNASASTSVTWIVDLVPPGAVTVTGNPAAVTAQTTASVSFNLTGDAVATECKLDAGAWAACTSPFVTGTIGEGSHTVQIRQLDGAGNVGTPTSTTWIVDLAPPTSAPVIASGPSGFVTAGQSAFAFLGAAGDETYQCRLDSGAWAACLAAYTTPLLADGAHTLDVRLVDAAANVGPTASRTWTIDTTAPSTAPTMATAPSNPNSDSTPTFAFSGAGAGETYQCRTDAGAWVACTSPITLPVLGEGTHTFWVRVIDGAGNTGPATSTTWTVDTTAPTTLPTIVSGPSAQTNQTSASFSFAGAVGGETYVCSLDGSAYVACTSPRSLTSLADGAHTFRVALVDAAGNQGPATAQTWTIGTSAPTALPTVTPSQGGTTNDTTPSFALSGGVSGGTFECRVDGGAWMTCVNPYTVSPALAPGTHTIEVRVVDAYGNAGAATSTTVVIDTTPPAAPTASTPPASPTNQTTASIGINGEAGATFECKLDTGAWVACSNPTALTNLADGPHTLQMRQIDTAGNTGPATSVSWTVDTAPPSPAPTITGTPISPASTSSATLTFAATEAGSTFECSTDGATWTTCTSPLSLSGLSEGGHVVKIREIDAAGNIGAISTASWIVDTTPPNNPPTVTGVPTGVTASGALSATFTGDAGNGFQCKLDFGGWGTCTSPFTTSGLADGQHTLSVRQIDTAGNAGPSVSSMWTVDSTAPTAPPLTGTPPALTSNTQPVFTFTGDGDTTFECSLDGTTWTTCSSPVQVAPALADGSYTFSTRQVDAAGNHGPVSSFAFTVSATAPPEVLIDNIPGSPTGETTADIFLTGEPGATIECAVDGGAWTTCTSPLSLTGLGEGAHEVLVRQQSAAIPPVQSAETAIRWLVDLTPPPAPAISGRPANPTTSRSATFNVTTAPDTTLECQLTPGATWAPCTPPLTFASLVDGTYTFQTRSIDSAGNISSPTSSTWTVDNVPPTGTAVVASGPAAQTASSVATFQFSYGADGTGALCSLDGAAFAPCATPVTIPHVDEGSHTFRIKPVDAAGNVGANITTYTWDVFIPTTPPPGPVGITIDGGATWIASSSAVIDIIWPAGTRYIELSNDAGFATVTRHAITTQLAWDLLPGSGQRTVYARFLDVAAAQISTSQDAVGVDPTAPGISAIEATWSGAGTVLVTPTMSDTDSGVASWQATTDPANPGAVIGVGTRSATIAAAAGATIYVRAIDGAGNVSAWVTRATPPVQSTAAGANTVVVAANATASTVAKVAGAGTANVALGCTATDGSACDIRIDLRYQKKVIASSSTRLASGARSTVSLKLPKDVQRQLAESGGLDLSMSVQAKTSAGEETKDTPLALTAPRATAIAAINPSNVSTSGASAQLTVRCGGTIPYHCAGPIQLYAVPQGRRSARAADPVVATASVKGAAGTNLPVKIVLNGTGKALLKKHGSLRVVARMSVPETGATKSSASFVFQTVRTDDWLRRVLAEMTRSTPARWFLNNTLDSFRAGHITAAEAARLIEKHTLDERQNTVKRIDLYLQAPASQKLQEHYLMLAYTQSVLADKKTIAWLKAGGSPATEPWRYHAKVSVTKAKLVKLLVKTATPLHIRVPQATELYP